MPILTNNMLSYPDAGGGGNRPGDGGPVRQPRGNRE